MKSSEPKVTAGTSRPFSPALPDTEDGALQQAQRGALAESLMEAKEALSTLESDSVSHPGTRAYNVLKIAPTSFFSDYGCHVRIYEETRALQQLGNRVTVCTYPSGHDPAGIEVRRCWGLPWDSSIRVGSSLPKLYHDAFLWLKGHQVARQIKPDVVHAHLHEGALIGWSIAKLHRTPLIFDFQGSLTSEMLDHQFIRRESLLFGPLRRLENVINHLADAIITSSHNAAEVLEQQFGYPAARTFTLPDSVDTEFFRPRWEVEDLAFVAEYKRKLGIPLDSKVVVYLGLLAEYQGIDKILEAAKILKVAGSRAHFLIMGYPADDYYRAVAHGLGLDDCVTITGRVPYREAPKFLLLGDVAVSPKLSETEGNGKLLNYMACGLPTVTFNTPVAREILGDLGVYARLGDETSLARAIAWLLQDDRAAQQVAQRLQEQAVAQYDWKETARALVSFYERVR